MRTGSKGQAAIGALALLLGLGLILYVCLADRRQLGLAILAVTAVTAGLLTLCAALTEPPVRGKGAQNG